MTSIEAMINPGVIILAQLKHSNYRFDIEDNIGESIHIHYRDIRLDFTIREFLEFSEKLAAAVDVLISGKNISREEYDPVFFADFAHLIPCLEKITYEYLMLDDLLIDTYDEQGQAVVRPLKESRILKALRGKSAENDSRNQVNYYSPGKPECSSNSERIHFNLGRIKESGGFAVEEFIVLFNDFNLIRDGQHRAACLYFWKGNVPVPVRRFWLAADLNRSIISEGAREIHIQNYNRFCRPIRFFELRNALKNVFKTTARAVLAGLPLPPAVKTRIRQLGRRCLQRMGSSLNYASKTKPLG